MGIAKGAADPVAEVELGQQKHHRGELAPPPPDFGEEYHARSVVAPSLRGGDLRQGDGPPTLDGTPPPPPPPPSSAVDTRVIRRLVLFSDGTGNSSAKAEKTNVWRMFQALDLTTSDQLAIYDDGVGTSTNKYLAAIGGAFGFGLKRNIIDLYKFVCRNYVDTAEKRTEIYGFGFSRGAYTIRVLMGLITSQGLVNFTSEDELHRHAVEAYGHFRRMCFKPPFFSPVHAVRWVRAALTTIAHRAARRSPYADRPRREIKTIRFIGLWDTVSAYGMPIDELRPAINWLFWPLYFSDLKLSPKIERACHALSLDDERTTFHPIIWDETDPADQLRLTQVWFAGVHANVGGGYPEDQLSLVSLDWMMRHAKESDLVLQQICVDRVSNEKSSFGRIYNSRAGFGMFYRYSPRAIIPRDKKPSAKMRKPIIHGSVIARMARGSDAYVPNALPGDFLVLTPNGELLPMQGFGQLGSPKAPIAAESNADEKKTPQILNTEIADERTVALKKAIQELNRPDAETYQLMLDTIWWRRASYLVSSIFALLIVGYPWLGDSADAAMESVSAIPNLNAISALWNSFEQLSSELRGMANNILEAISAFIPGWFESWANAIREHPLEVVVLIGMLLASLSVSESLRRRLRDFGLNAWHASLRKPFRDSLVATQSSAIRRSWHLLVIFDAAFLLVATMDATAQTAAKYFVATGIVNIVVLGRIYMQSGLIRTLRRLESPTPADAESKGFTRWIRNSKLMRVTHRVVGDAAVPALCGIAMVYLLATLGNRVAFDLESGSGRFCQTRLAVGDNSTVNRAVSATSLFNTSEFCWSSGRSLEAKARYRIIVEDNQDNWFDRKTPTDPRGFTAHNLMYVGATPLKRWWREPWFTPIARVGKSGNQEYALQPCVYVKREEPKSPNEFIPAYVQRIGDEEAKAIKDRTFAGPEGRKVLIAEFTPQAGGELFLFVNDAVLAVPSVKDYFYKNNRGTASVTIEQVHDDGVSKYHTFCPK